LWFATSSVNSGIADERHGDFSAPPGPVWFGSHVIANYCAEPELAERYAAAMDRRFAGLMVTNEPLRPPDDTVSGRSAPELPSDQLL
jgi:hypothetical protein